MILASKQLIGCLDLRFFIQDKFRFELGEFLEARIQLGGDVVEVLDQPQRLVRTQFEL